MGLKAASRLTWFARCSLLKSDQDGIERNSGKSSIATSASCWNQTKMGLKGNLLHPPRRLTISVEIRPRWDWKAFRQLRRFYPYNPPLKSDQDGIESFTTIFSSLLIDSVEIRPRWDWKRFCLALCGFLYLLLKSDQDGIERLVVYSLHLRVKVEIRPRWDWKKNLKGIVDIHVNSWNQTKMGLKASYISSTQHRPLFSLKSDQDGIERRDIFSIVVNPSVEIRPRWDWKKMSCQRLSGRRAVEIRPRWDWKTPVTVTRKVVTVSLKSDQDGIERMVSRQHGRQFIMVEIRPRWDWKQAEGAQYFYAWG